MTTLPHVIRPARDTDYGFILDSWLRELARESGIHFADEEEIRAFKRRARNSLVSVIETPGVETLVAHMPGAETQLYGWICGRRPDRLHFIYVSLAWRRGGIGNALVEASGVRSPCVATGYTRKGFRTVKHMFASVDYDPTAT